MSDKMGGLEGSLNGLLKEAEKMQSKMKEAQRELTELVVVGKSGGGMVAVQMNGRHEASKVTIAKSLMDEDVGMLEDLIAAAINAAVQQVEKISKEKITALTAGLQLPGGFMEGEAGEQ